MCSNNNRLDTLMQLINCHQQYLDPFLKIHNFILRGDGPLSYSFRHYIAIMAAARHQCSYLVNLEKDEFIKCGGDRKWLQGLDKIPVKLRDLNELNKIMAHQPWLLNKGHIEKLTKGNDSWSLAEVVHAIVLLAHFHCLSSLVLGSGISDSMTLDGHSEGQNGHTVTAESGDRANGVEPPSPQPQANGSPPVGGEVDTLMKKMQEISEAKNGEGRSLEELVKGFEKVESQSAEIGPLNGVVAEEEDVAALGKFVDDPGFTYVDFARRRESNDVTTFRVQDYSWNDHGFSLANRLYSDVGNLLDDKFKVAYNMTYYTMGRKTNVDTSMFRRAIWNYIQCMYGIRHDDYDYREVNDLLDKSFKTYIKTVCCFPHKIAKRDTETILREFRRSEKVHMNLMISEARMQAELLYALRAVMKYMT